MAHRQQMLLFIAAIPAETTTASPQYIIHQLAHQSSLDIIYGYASHKSRVGQIDN